jgi:hypothetical protein
VFANLAHKLRDMGWKALIPLKPGNKAPAITGWQHFNTAPPSDEQIDNWGFSYPNGGIGLAFGPDGVIGFDLDFKDPEIAAKTTVILHDTVGTTDLVRIGQPPKSLRLFKADNVTVTGRAFGGFEIYSVSGQCVFYGIHPGTGEPYSWPVASPEELGPDDLPVVTQDAMDAFLEAMEPYREDRVTVRGRAIKNSGNVAPWLQAFNQCLSVDEMVAMAVEAVDRSTAGHRHYTMSATVTALVTKGVAPRLFGDAITDAYERQLTQDEAYKRASAVTKVIDWADAKIWDGRLTKPLPKMLIEW